jgi:hypothetical protein
MGKPSMLLLDRPGSTSASSMRSGVGQRPGGTGGVGDDLGRDVVQFGSWDSLVISLKGVGRAA